MTWYEAKAACKARSGHLVEVNTEEKQTLLTAEVQRRGLHSTHYMWIDLNDLDSEGVWRWSQSGTVASFSAWNAGQPNGPTNGGQHCVGLDQSTKWNDLWCDRREFGSTSFGAICEYWSI